MLQVVITVTHLAMLEQQEPEMVVKVDSVQGLIQAVLVDPELLY
jgi:hypothetical protein